MKKYMALLMVPVILALLTGCGSSGGSSSSGSFGRQWSDDDAIDAYGTVVRNGEVVNVCVCHDRNAVYLYYDDDNHKLYDTAIIPTDELYDSDNDWYLGLVSNNDINGDNNSDLQVYLSHSDMTESHIVWTWEENKGYVYQAYDSSFYNSGVVIDPPEDTGNDLSIYEGLWLSNEENLYENTYLQFDAEGNWQLYSDGEVKDYGYLQYDAEDGLTYARGNLNSAMDDGFVSIDGDRINISTCGSFDYLDGRGGRWEGNAGENMDDESN